MSEVAWAVKVGNKWVGWEDGDLVNEWWFRAAWDRREYAKEIRAAWAEGGHEARLVSVTRKRGATRTEDLQHGYRTGRQAALEEAEKVCRERATSQYGAMAIHLADAIAALRSK